MSANCRHRSAVPPFGKSHTLPHGKRKAVELPGGARIPSYYVLEYPDWVNVIARTDDGRFLLIDQYRHGLGRTSYEIVAGVRDPQDATPLDAARRELYEETGYGGGEWKEYMLSLIHI